MILCPCPGIPIVRSYVFVNDSGSTIKQISISTSNQLPIFRTLLSALQSFSLSESCLLSLFTSPYNICVSPVTFLYTSAHVTYFAFYTNHLRNNSLIYPRIAPDVLWR